MQKFTFFAQKKLINYKNSRLKFYLYKEKNHYSAKKTNFNDINFFLPLLFVIKNIEIKQHLSR